MAAPAVAPEAEEIEDFFIIWNPNSPTPPTKTYTSHSQAMGIAKRMARRFAGHYFYVLRVEGCFQQQGCVHFWRAPNYAKGKWVS